MSLKDQYPRVPEEDWKDMIKRGIISCSINTQDNILSCVKKHKDAGTSHTEAVKITAEEMRCTEQWVYEVIRNWGK